MCQHPSFFALIGREGLTGMIGVDKIGDIRRVYFEQGRPIKEIVRTVSVSRATVRKVIRSHGTDFKYEREGESIRARDGNPGSAASQTFRIFHLLGLLALTLRRSARPGMTSLVQFERNLLEVRLSVAASGVAPSPQRLIRYLCSRDSRYGELGIAWRSVTPATGSRRASRPWRFGQG
jgi:hypothetical protein